MSGPVRVAQVVGKMVGGGVEQVVMNYYRHVDRSRVQFDFLVDADSTLVPRDEIEGLGGRVLEVPPYQRPVAYQRELARLFCRERWSIVHSHINTLSVFPLRAAKRAGVPVRIAHSHSTAGRGELAKNALKYALRPLANVYPTHRMACSRYAGEWLFGKGADFEVIPNAIELDRFSFDPEARAEVRSELGVSGSQLLIGHIGRFMPQKNQTFLVDAFAGAVGKGKDAVLALIGEGPMRAEVEKRALSSGVFDRVLFLGQREDVCRLYQAFDLLCLPSLYEGLGIVAVEAQRSGVFCILSENIPLDADVTGTSSFISLDAKSDWIDGILCAEANSRISVDDELFANYDIKKAAPILARRYELLATELSPMDKRTSRE